MKTNNKCRRTRQESVKLLWHFIPSIFADEKTNIWIDHTICDLLVVSIVAELSQKQLIF